MRILYAVQATGNGHISRAVQILPYLSKFGLVDVFLSGANSQLKSNLPIKYRSTGVNLFYGNSGGLDYFEIIRSIAFRKVLKEAKELPIHKYDLVINDFEFITSLSCMIHNKPSIHFGHQASFQSSQTPKHRPSNKIGQVILQKFVKSTDYLGLHFQSYDNNIYNPIIKEEILSAKSINKGHITVYLPQYSNQFLSSYLNGKPNIQFEVFTKEVKEKKRYNNITFLPIENNTFSLSLISCSGLITAGGFETPAEAMYLKKKLMCIPIKKHYEQQCNGEALKQMGIKVIDKIDTKFNGVLENWLKEENIIELKLTYSTENIIEKLMEKSQLL